MVTSFTRATVSDPYFLKTARIAFRCWSKDDLPLAMSLWGDPEVTKYLGGPFSAEQINARLENEIATMEAHGIQYWPFFLLPNFEHAGCCGLRPRKLEERIYEFGRTYPQALLGARLGCRGIARDRQIRFRDFRRPRALCRPPSC